MFGLVVSPRWWLKVGAMLRGVTWKQAVMDAVVSLVNESGERRFHLRDLYGLEDYFQRLFPRNHRIPEKLRQIVQFLRDDGLLIAHGAGNYELNSASPHVEEAELPQLPAGRQPVPTRPTRRIVRLRDTVLGLHLKLLYRYRCQVCGSTVPLTQEDYAESHHLRPLGSPHAGPDTPGNVVVLCPDHHVMFDRGAASIQPDSLRPVHARSGISFPHNRIHLVRPHRLARVHLEYHYRRIFQGRC